MENNNELIDVIKVQIPHVADLRDFELYSLHVVLKGRALLLQQPSVPFFMLHEQEDVFRMEKERCIRQEQVQTIAVNSILEDPRRQVRKTLIYLPDGMRVSANLSEKIMDGEKCTLNLRAMNKSVDVGKIKKKKYHHSFHPCFWYVRTIGESRKMLKITKTASFDELDQAFGGMAVS